MFRQRLIWIGLGVVFLSLFACSLSRNSTQSVPPATTPTTASTAPQPAAPGQSTLPPAVTLTETSMPTEKVAPTETSTPTETPTATPKPRVTAATVQPRGTVAPLAVRYEVVKITRVEGDQALLTLKVIATGGRGGYLYYHDDIQQAGATFNIPGRCNKPFVHTIKVTSSDGQTVALPYHVGGLCPTPTP